MPFIANTPESLVARSDSKNPATTCRGITSSGRPCRRPLSAINSPQASFGLRRAFNGRLRVDDPRDETLYCWQHKEQASMSARSSPSPQTAVTPIFEERTSIDTLADRLGLLGVNSSRNQRDHAKFLKPLPRSTSSPTKYKKQHKTAQSRASVLFCCFFQIPLDEPPSAPPHPKPRLEVIHPSLSLPRFAHTSSNKQHTVVEEAHVRLISLQSSRIVQGQCQSLPAQLHSAQRTRTASQTAQYLSSIPATASPQTASALMAELAKPISQLDEPGYIYMFWLTSEYQQTIPPAEAARSLLVPPSRSSAGTAAKYRAGDAVSSFAMGDVEEYERGRASSIGADHGWNSSNNSNNGKRTLLLKIGRASNVQRRLNEWKRQCGYDLSLIRYYPYIPSSSGSGSTVSARLVPRKIPHSHKVERLIHIELAGLGLRIMDGQKCDACGREHREWFRVEATRNAVMNIDGVIRRWTDWDEGQLQEV